MNALKKLQDVQDQYPVFVFDSYTIEHRENQIQIIYKYLCGIYTFLPKISIFGVTPEKWLGLDVKVLETYIFNLGMTELLSYWKAFCSPIIEIKVSSLSSRQTQFWEKLFLNGLAEFFYVNGMVPFTPTFKCKGNDNNFAIATQSSEINSNNNILIPIGGGKDSIVTLELLATSKANLFAFTINENTSAEDTIQIFQQKYPLKNHIRMQRSIDPKLYELNRDGFFNGHTPFSAIIAWTSTLVSFIFNIDQIALSNERSANEETLLVMGVPVNHQYSKSFEFEKDFRDYLDITLLKHPLYFSMLRPWYELQISKIFATYPNYFERFRSCNVGKKTNSWCGKCPKCLFVSLMLSAFLEPQAVYSIFGKAMLDDSDLDFYFQQLIGVREAKSFECIGTRKESQLASFLIVEKYKSLNIALPKLIEMNWDKIMINPATRTNEVNNLLCSFDEYNFIPEALKGILIHDAS